jgi:hypothetical protein
MVMPVVSMAALMLVAAVSPPCIAARSSHDTQTDCVQGADPGDTAIQARLVRFARPALFSIKPLIL